MNGGCISELQATRAPLLIRKEENQDPETTVDMEIKYYTNLNSSPLPTDNIKSRFIVQKF